jgi:dephospho-CoA kinase
MRQARKPVVGIVGGIGSGKSLVAAELAALGGYSIDADQLGHEALRQTEIKSQVIERWGRGVVDERGEIKRRALGKIVFAEPAQRQALESLVFPWIERRIKEEVERAQSDPRCSFVILDAAIMLETGWNRVCDKILFVDAPRATRLERLARQRGWSEEELSRREISQMPLEQKKKRADAAIANTGDAASLRAELKKIQNAWGWACEPGPRTGQ